MKKVIILYIIFAVHCVITGCSIQIFEDEAAKYSLKEIDKDDLKDGAYYIKNGTKFGELYMPNGTISGGVQKISPNRLLWLQEDKGKIPTYYKGEVIAHASKKYSNEPIAMERYKDVGYSIGIYGATYQEEGYISFNLKKNCVKGSQIYKELENAKSEEFRIIEINGNPVTADMINSGGILSCCEQEKEYTISLYEGTYYNTITAKADVWFLQSYEGYTIQDIEDTKNGYISIRLPEDLKSGYYYLSRVGVFRYINQKQIDISNEDEIDMNETYYQTEEEQIKAFSQQYSLIFKKKAMDTKIIAKYTVSQNLQEDEIKGLVTAPDGTTYECTVSEGYITCDLKETIAGSWTLNITPARLVVTSIDIQSNNPGEEKQEEVYEFSMTDLEEVEFIVEYAGTGTVSALLTGEQGETIPFEKPDKKVNKLICNIPYIKEGNYKVKVYHNTDSEITNVTYAAGGKNIQKDIFVITE